MHIDLYYTDKSGKITIPHDLNFLSEHYDGIHTVTFKNPSQNLQQILRETGPLPSDEDRRNRKVEGGSKKQKKPFDVEKMADALVKLEEDDLLQVIQMIHDHKSDDTYIQNNLDGKCPRRLRAVTDFDLCPIPTFQTEQLLIFNLLLQLASSLLTSTLSLITSAR